MPIFNLYFRTKYQLLPKYRYKYKLFYKLSFTVLCLSVTLFRVGFVFFVFLFLAVAYLMVANLARLVIWVRCQVSFRSQYLVRLLSQRWVTGGHTIHPPIEGLLPPTGIEPTSFRNSASKVAGLQVHATTPGISLRYRANTRQWLTVQSKLK